jgi:hypothetical protein
MTVPAGQPGPGEEDEVPEPVFDRLQDWVEEQFLPGYPRPLGGEYRWCRQWWRHGEAITRLTALWHSWEVMRLQPGTGMASWLRDYLDHQLPILLGRAGPFAGCSESEHIDPHVPASDPQPGWWDGTGPDALPVLLPGADHPEHLELPGDDS